MLRRGSVFVGGCEHRVGIVVFRDPYGFWMIIHGVWDENKRSRYPRPSESVLILQPFSVLKIRSEEEELRSLIYNITHHKFSRQEKVVGSNVVTGLEVAGLDGEIFFDLPKIFTQGSMPVHRGNIPHQRGFQKWPHLKCVHLPEIDAEVELLIGTNVPRALEPQQVIRSADYGPYVIRTILGWTVNGPLGGDSGDGMDFATVNRISVVNLDELWQQQFKIDFPECCHDERPGLSREDQRFMELVSQSAKLVDGHYQVALPLRKSKVNMPNNRKVAEQHALNLQRRFKKDSSFWQQYTDFMNDIISKGYAEQVPTEELERSDGRLWYIPHHGVYHPR